MSKDEDVPVSSGSCDKRRTSCRTANISVIGVLITIVGLIIAGMWNTVSGSQDDISDLQTASASQAATLSAIKDDTKEIKELLRYERSGRSRNNGR